MMIDERHHLQSAIYLDLLAIIFHLEFALGQSKHYLLLQKYQIEEDAPENRPQ